VQRRCRIERTPDFALRRAARALDGDHGVQAGERLVHRDPLHTLDAENRAQVMEVDRFHRDAADDARFARRHLADEGGQNRTAPPGDCGHLHEGIVFLQVHVAMRFAEWCLGLQQFGIDQALDDDLRFGRNQQIDGFGPRHVDGTASEPARHSELVEILRQLLYRSI
jgi:hypothetical protein